MAASDYGSKHTKVLDRNRMAASRRRACVDRRETAFSRVATRIENAPPSGGSGPVRLLQREQGAVPIMGVRGGFTPPTGRAWEAGSSHAGSARSARVSKKPKSAPYLFQNTTRPLCLAI